MPVAVLGLDIGTTSVKAVVVARAGKVLGEGSSDPITTTTPTAGASEQDPADLWAAVVAAVQRAVSSLEQGVSLAGLAMAAQSGSVVPVAGDRVVGPVVTWMDMRALSIIEGFSPEQRSLVRRVSGWTPSAGLGLATIAWLRSQAMAEAPPERFAGVDSFIAHRLTGEWVTNPSNAAGFQLMDVLRLEWDGELCALAGIEPAVLVPIAATGCRIGGVQPAAAAVLGLPPGLPVFAGGHDQACAAVALGITEPGAMMLSAGTAWVLTAATDSADVAALADSLNLSPHAVAGRWTTSRHLGGIGAVIAGWLRTAYERPDELESDLTGFGPTSTTPAFLPNLLDSGGAGLGRFVPAPGDTSRAERSWAVLEAAAFSVRQAVEAITSTTEPVTSLTVIGGGSRPAVLRTLADATGLVISVPRHASWPALGAAQVAATALGWDLPPAWAAPGGTDTVEPRADIIGGRYAAYRRLIEGRLSEGGAP